MEMIIKETYPPEYVRMITGGRQENQALLTQRFDKIFLPAAKPSAVKYSAMPQSI